MTFLICIKNFCEDGFKGLRKITDLKKHAGSTSKTMTTKQKLTTTTPMRTTSSPMRGKTPGPTRQLNVMFPDKHSIPEEGENVIQKVISLGKAGNRRGSELQEE